MIKVLLNNHEVKNDVFELIRLFFPGEEIILLENVDKLSKDGLSIISSLENLNGKLYSLILRFIGIII